MRCHLQLAPLSVLLFCLASVFAITSQHIRQEERGLQISTPHPLVPDATEHYVTVRSKTYYYIRALPTQRKLGTVLLLHGFPDLSLGWKYQITFLSQLGYQVIVPDLLGYGNTDSPPELKHWAYRELATDLAFLLDTVVPGERVILGGQDWGATIAYRCILWYPQLYRALFTIGIPLEFLPLTAEYVDVPELIRTTRPTLGYQLAAREFAADRRFETYEQYAQLINAAFNGVTADGEYGFSPDEGWLFDNLPRLLPNTFFSPEEFEYYTRQYYDRGVRGGNNYYRLMRLNWEDERQIREQGWPNITVPALYINSTGEAVSLPEYAEGQEKYFNDLTLAGPVVAGHWVNFEAPNETNAILQTWLAGVE